MEGREGKGVRWAKSGREAGGREGTILISWTDVKQIGGGGEGGVTSGPLSDFSV